MSTSRAFDTDVVSVTDAAGRGVPALVREAEQGHDVVVARHGRPVAAGISIRRLERRHPEAVSTVDRLTNDAVDDLGRLIRRGDPQVVRWAFKKMIHLKQDPEAGEALVGGIMGWRKITVGDRDWRLVWRLTHDSAGVVIVHVAEVWAFGARSDAEVYEEMKGRIATAPLMPHTKALAEVLATLGRLTDDIRATPGPTAPNPPPRWLREALCYVVRLPADQVDVLTREAAEQVWADYPTGRGR